MQSPQWRVFWILLQLVIKYGYFNLDLFGFSNEETDEIALNKQYLWCKKHDWVSRWLLILQTRLLMTVVPCTPQLLFNEAIAASASNRATRVDPPAPIVIERLLPLSEQRDRVDSTRSSISFTTLSEERLQAAVKLAKRDLRRRHFESLRKSPARPSHQASFFETSDPELLRVLYSAVHSWHIL